MATTWQPAKEDIARWRWFRLRRIKDWNKAAMLRHLWALCKKAVTLWIKWVHTYTIKEQCVWTMEIPCDATWTIRKLLGLRQTSYYQVSSWKWGEHLFMIIRYLEPTWTIVCYIWWKGGHWCGQVFKGKGSLHNDQGSWRWPRSRNPVIQAIIAQTPQDLRPHPEVCCHLVSSSEWCFQCQICLECH